VTQENASAAAGKGLAITALVLGILGLFTGGLLAVGSLLGLGLACVALMGTARAGRDVAWAAIFANAFALLTLFPLSAAYWAYRESPAFARDDDSLPEPAVKPFGGDEAEPAIVLPPPPPASLLPPPAAPLLARSAKSAKPALEEAAPVVPVRVSGNIQEPRKTRNVSPVYPRAALESRTQGVVVLECTISPQGKVVEVKTLRSVPLLDDAAITAVKQWEYTPTLLDGVAVPVIMTVTVNFRLN